MKCLWPRIVKPCEWLYSFQKAWNIKGEGNRNKSVHKKNWERERKSSHCVHRREKFLKILRVYSGDSDHYCCTINRGRDAGRLSKDHVQGSRYAGHPWCLVDAPAVSGSSAQCVPGLQVASFVLFLNSVLISQKQRREVPLNHWCKVIVQSNCGPRTHQEDFCRRN